MRIIKNEKLEKDLNKLMDEKVIDVTYSRRDELIEMLSDKIKLDVEDDIQLYESVYRGCRLDEDNDGFYFEPTEKGSRIHLKEDIKGGLKPSFSIRIGEEHDNVNWHKQCSYICYVTALEELKDACVKFSFPHKVGIIMNVYNKEIADFINDNMTKVQYDENLEEYCKYLKYIDTKNYSVSIDEQDTNMYQYLVIRDVEYAKEDILELSNKIKEGTYKCFFNEESRDAEINHFSKKDDLYIYFMKDDRCIYYENSILEDTVNLSTIREDKIYITPCCEGLYILAKDNDVCRKLKTFCEPSKEGYVFSKDSTRSFIETFDSIDEDYIKETEAIGESIVKVDKLLKDVSVTDRGISEDVIYKCKDGFVVFTESRDEVEVRNIFKSLGYLKTQTWLKDRKNKIGRVNILF